MRTRGKTDEQRPGEAGGRDERSLRPPGSVRIP